MTHVKNGLENKAGPLFTFAHPLHCGHMQTRRTDRGLCRPRHALPISFYLDYMKNLIRFRKYGSCAGVNTGRCSEQTA